MMRTRQAIAGLLLTLALACLAGRADGQTVSAVRIAGDTQRTDTACAIASGSTALTCAGGLFTAADANYGMPVKVAGAGASGADLVTTVAGYTSATQVTLAAAASTTVSGASAAWGVTHNGWVAEFDISGLSTGGTYNTGLTAQNDPAAANAVFTVTSPGYDASGAATSTTRTVYCVNPMRRPYPNQAANEEYAAGGTVTVKCVLSDYIYAGEAAAVTIGAGFYTQGTANAAASLTAANNSTAAYPAVLARWAWPGYETMTGATHLLEAVAFHHFPRTGKPVAAVTFSCTDQHAHTAAVTTNTLAVSARGGDANPVLVYAANMPTASLTQGDVATCNFKAYPWVGNAASVADSAGTSGWNTNTVAGTEKLGPQTYLVDTAGSYGQAHATVDPTNGSDASCGMKVYASRAAADAAYAASTANSFATWGKAFTCAKAYGTRANANNGIYVWVNGTIAMPGANAPTSDSGAADTWTQIAPATGYACTIGSGTNAYYYVRLLKVMGCAITGSSAGQFRGDGTMASRIWLDQTAINQTGAAPLWAYGMIYATRNTITAMGANQFSHYSTSRGPTFLRSNTGAGVQVMADFYTALGNKQFYGYLVGADATPAGQGISDNAIVAYNSTLNFNSAAANVMRGATSAATVTTIATGLAMVQNLYEKTAATSPEMFLFPDQVAAAGTNMLLWMNTFVGERTNMMYNDGGTSYFGCNGGGAWTQASIVGNLFSNENVKADTFSATSYGCSPGPSGLRTNNWGVRMGPGRVANVPITRATTSACNTASNYQGPLGTGNTFGPEFGGLYSPSTLVAPKYASDKSCGGDSGTGNGNYHLTGSPVSGAGIPAAYIPLPYDLNGSPRVTAGAGSIGAYEYQKSAARPGGGWW